MSRERELREKETRTYKDFIIGQKVVCTGTLEDFGDFYIDPGYTLTTGKTYKINDLDFHFPDKICIKGDNGKGGFFPIALFDDLKYIRNIKINEILNEK